MNREEKEKQVAWLREQFVDVKALFLTDFRSLTVSEMNQLRVELRKSGGQFKVLKNTLTRLAYADTDVAAIAPHLSGSRAAAWTKSDDSVPAIAKALVDFAKKNPKLVLVGGVLGGKPVGASELDALSKLPSREELLSRLLGTMKAPIGAFAGVLAAIPRSLLFALKAIEEQKAGGASETAAPQ